MAMVENRTSDKCLHDLPATPGNVHWDTSMPPSRRHCESGAET
jgi:hypothetical protein